MSEVLIRVTAPQATFAFVVDTVVRRVVDCAPYGRRALLGRTVDEAVTACRVRRWRTEIVRPSAEVPT